MLKLKAGVGRVKAQNQGRTNTGPRRRRGRCTDWDGFEQATKRLEGEPLQRAGEVAQGGVVDLEISTCTPSRLTSSQVSARCTKVACHHTTED